MPSTIILTADGNGNWDHDGVEVDFDAVTPQAAKFIQFSDKNLHIELDDEDAQRLIIRSRGGEYVLDVE